MVKSRKDFDKIIEKSILNKFKEEAEKLGISTEDNQKRDVIATFKKVSSRLAGSATTEQKDLGNLGFKVIKYLSAKITKQNPNSSTKPQERSRVDTSAISTNILK